MSLAGKLVRKVVGRVLKGRGAPDGVPPGGSRAEAHAGRTGGAATPPASSAASAAPLPTAPPDEDSLEVELPIPGSLLVDIREPGELASGVAEGALLLPMDLVPHHLDELPRDQALTIYCAAGARSFGVAHWLREQGFPKAYSLAGGIGVFPAVDHPVAPPPGIMPGTRVKLPPDALAGTVPVGPGVVGEVIRQVDDHVEVVVRDTQGFPVRVTAPVWALAKG